jgi:hypothetical protein
MNEKARVDMEEKRRFSKLQERLHVCLLRERRKEREREKEGKREREKDRPT